MPAIFPVLAAYAGTIGTAAVMGGAAYGATQMKGKKPVVPGAAPAPAIPAIPAVPTPKAAEETAQAKVEKERRMRMLRGGKTILTSESPVLTGGGGKTLLGS